MMGMCRHGATQFLMAAQARRIGGFPPQLVIGVAVMQRMAGQTRELSSLKTRRLDDATIFAAADPNHAVRPELGFKHVGSIAVQGCLEPRRVAGDTWTHERVRCVFLVTGTEMG